MDRFADICVEYADDNEGFLLALGDEFGIKGGMGAVAAFRKILSEIAGGVADELQSERADKVGFEGDMLFCSKCGKHLSEDGAGFAFCPYCGAAFNGPLENGPTISDVTDANEASSTQILENA